MQPTLSAAILFAPAAFFVSAILAHSRALSTRSTLVSSQFAALLAALATAIAWVGLALDGPSTLTAITHEGWGLSLRVDTISLTLATLVSFVGLIVIRFSRNYLAGEPRQAAFIGGLATTLSAVLVLVLSGNLGLLAAGWIATSLSLQRMLVFYPERPRAQLAARRKFLVARAADGFLLVALVCLGSTAGTGDIIEIGAVAEGWASAGSIPLAATIGALALVLAAALKSAQFPTHGWLIDVAETPTPVSALLHAGLINAGGFLVIRLAALVIIEPLALTALVVIGSLTAVLGSLTMMTQTRAKNALAYSTITQMGFMLVQCGLGAFSAALVHLVAHSLYKAHAFLRAASVVEQAEPRTTPAHTPSLASLMGMALASLAVLVGVGWSFGFDPSVEPGVFVLGGVLALALSVGLSGARTETRPRPSTLGLLALATASLSALYFGIQLAAHTLYAPVLPAPAPLPVAVIAAGAVALLGFAAVVILQALLPRLATSERWARLYVLAKNDFYVGRWATDTPS